MLRILATVEDPEVPITSPAILTELLVVLATILLRPAPLPKNAPANLLLTFVSELAPLKVFEPVKIWFPLSNGTLLESRASASVPEETFDAFSVLMLAPFPVKVPLNRLFALFIVAAPLKVLEP